MFQTDLEMEILKKGKIDEDDDDVGAIGIRFKVVNSSMFLFAPSHTMFQSMGAPFLQRMTASMRDFIDEDIAYHCSSRVLSDVIRVFEPDVIPSVAGEVAFMLCYWTHHAIQRRFNSLELEISLESIKHCRGSYDDHHQNTTAHEVEEEEDDDDDDVEEQEEKEKRKRKKKIMMMMMILKKRRRRKRKRKRKKMLWQLGRPLNP